MTALGLVVRALQLAAPAWTPVMLRVLSSDGHAVVQQFTLAVRNTR